MNSKLKFHHVAVKFKDIKRAIDFFKALGFKVISEFKTQKGKSVICLKKDGFIIEAFETFSDIESKGVMKHLAFSVDDIHSAVKELQNMGIKFIEETTRAEDADGKVFYFAYFLGPEGIKLELHQEGEGNGT